MLRKRKILVVEDQAEQWKLIRLSIEKTMPDTETVWAGNLEDALDYLQTQTKLTLPNLIFLDLYLPTREDGWQFLKQIKQNELYRYLPVVVFSNSALPEDINESYNLGCSSYMTKPLNGEGWLSDFTVLCNYWWQTVLLFPN